MTNQKTASDRGDFEKSFHALLCMPEAEYGISERDNIWNWIESYALKKQVEVLEEFRSRKGKLIEVPHVDGGIAEIYAYPTIDKWVEEKLNQLSK